MTPLLSNAAWITKVEDSIFDEKTAILFGEVSQTSAIVIQCKGDDLYLSYIEQDTASDIAGKNVTLLIKVDDNKPIEFDAVMSRRNMDFIQATGREPYGILSVLDELRTAKKKFMVGLTIKGTDFRMSYSGNVYRSTAETNKFIKACDIKY